MVDLDDFRYYTEWHHHANERRYEAPADPWRLVPVDPAGVERFAVVELTWGLDRVRGGDWDRPENCRSLTDTRMYEGLVERFEEGCEWEETPYWEWVRGEIEELGHFRGYEDPEAVRAERLPAVEDLYESLREEGYRPNHGTLYDDPAEVEFIHEFDPMVLIGRDGEVIWTEGFHRLILSRIAGVDGVPALVLRRHEDWQRVRDRVDDAPAGDLPPDLDEYAGHPDLPDRTR